MTIALSDCESMLVSIPVDYPGRSELEKQKGNAASSKSAGKAYIFIRTAFVLLQKESDSDIKVLGDQIKGAKMQAKMPAKLKKALNMRLPKPLDEE